MCLMTFEELCAKNLGAADYIALAGAFHTLALRGIPIFNNSTRSEAYRFVTLIDVLYEQRIRILCSAAALPQVLFSKVMSQQEAKDARVSKCHFCSAISQNRGNARTIIWNGGGLCGRCR